MRGRSYPSQGISVGIKRPRRYERFRVFGVHARAGAFSDRAKRALNVLLTLLHHNPTMPVIGLYRIFIQFIYFHI